MGTIDTLKNILFTLTCVGIVANDADRESAIAEAISQLEWFSVNDKMPEKETYVFVVFDDGFMTTVYFNNDGEWELWADCGEITHWKRLPTPPERE